MPTKRKRRTSPPSKGLAAGEQLKRAKLAAGDSSTWAWVDTEVSDPSQITLEHRLMTCGLSKRNKNPFCANKHAPKPAPPSPASAHETQATIANGELETDVIVVSDDEPPPCNKKECKNNPNCLNYLGQLQWEDEATARQLFIKASDLGLNPILGSRDPELPVGLKNLGATCYANAFLQVWFRDLAFRRGVYQCQPSHDTENGYEDSPVFQLQVTFAALQESTQNVYNPVKFAESLKLSTSEQQDAQEFSKLFMSHLDNEFKKQLTPSLQTLISDQFQGKLVYGTRCHNCRYKSERSSDFLELEINIENNARLEDRIAALLQDEKLTGDNKYSCANCARLQDATRYTELRSLPPVLHFSLLRFVYDFDSMERKKSKHNLLFPMILDMSKFVKADKSVGGVEGNEGATNLYELRGVLLHKGPSAYHGHYEAQVLDTASKTWFQFDDEVVTKIDFLGEKRYTGKDIVDVLNDSGTTKKSAGQPRARSAKKRRIDDSDDEGAELPLPTETKVSLPGKAPEGDVFSSRDAYMLIYARKEEEQSVGHAPTPNLAESTLDSNSSIFINGASRPCTESQNISGPTILAPSQRARDVVKTLNARHDEACELYSRKEQEVKEHFAELREWMRSVYTHWHVASVEEDAVVVRRQALENWLTKPFAKPEEHKSRSQSVAGDAEIEVLPTPDILCGHDGLNPHKATNMKRMSRNAYEKLSLREDIGPVRTPQEVCEICVKESFTERLYQIEHPRSVAQFDEMCDVQQGEPGYWISKAWLKGWRVQKPRMHVPLHGDPSPDSTEFRGHVRCEHDQLSLVSTARRSISSQACEILKKLFPDWAPLSTNQEPCAICEACIHSSKEDKRELRKKAEDEKARLRHMHDNALIGNTLLLENVPCAVLPADFVRIWRKWLSRPAEIPRPDSVDTSPLFCQHDMLVLDPNAPNDWDSDVALIQMSEWHILQELYSCGPAVAVEKRFVEDSVGILDTKFVHDTPVCHDCRLKRRRDYNLTDITVRFLSSKPVTGGEHDEGLQRGSQHAKQESGPRTTGGTRQSKRIRQGRGETRENTRLSISKSTTVKDIKVQLHESLKIPTICQRLFYKGQELQDNTVTVESLGILMNDTLDLREETENEESLSHSPEGRASKRRKEEKGFGGTLLAASASYASLSADTGTSSEGEGHESTTKTCPACTFHNSLDSLLCGMCGQKVTEVV
ncbi:cysteine proteinase [Imleria badia]|nr:cysteine proteinase [Imleria badia]